MLKNGSNNPIRRQRPKDGPDACAPPEAFRAVSLKAIAELLDTTRSSARRWLKEAGIRPISLGRGAKGAIRYRWSEVEAWLKSRQYVE
jgi:predicted DNA-binding transcriptional regulator AlpA